MQGSVRGLRFHIRNYAYFWEKLVFPIEKTPRIFPGIFPEASWESLDPQYMVFQYRKTTI